MAFWATTFVFDDIPSETFNLLLISEDAAGVITNTGSNSVELYTQEIYRRPSPYFFGTQQSPVLEFTLCFASLKAIDAGMQRKIQQWLFGHSTYKKLQIMQCDMDDAYFNCILSEPEVVTIGNYAYSFKCTATCDAPWAWGFWHTTNFGPIVDSAIITYNNTTDNNYYTYPQWEIELSGNGNQFSIVNQTDNNSTTTFTSLLQKEIISIDSDRGIIKSSTGLLRFSNFSGILPRLLPGMNKLEVVGNITNLSVTMRDAKKVSA